MMWHAYTDTGRRLSVQDPEDNPTGRAPWSIIDMTTQPPTWEASGDEATLADAIDAAAVQATTRGLVSGPSLLDWLPA